MIHMLMLLMILLNFSCAHSVPDVKVCARLLSGAACSTTLSKERSRMTEEEFKRIEFGVFFMLPEAYGKIRNYLIKSCRRKKSCSLEELTEELAELEEDIFPSPQLP